MLTPTLPIDIPKLICIRDRSWAFDEIKHVMVLAQNGLFAVLHASLGEIPFLRVVNPIHEFPAAEVLEFYPYTDTTHLHVPKIPAGLFMSVVAFFREVFALYEAEALIFGYYNANLQEWRLEVPIQTVSRGKVHTPDIPDIGDDWYQVLSLHSHGAYSAYHSPADDKDELFGPPMLHATVGTITQNEVEVSLSFVSGGTRLFLSLNTVFETPSETSPYSYDFPSNWMDCLTYEEEEGDEAWV